MWLGGGPGGNRQRTVGATQERRAKDLSEGRDQKCSVKETDSCSYEWDSGMLRREQVGEIIEISRVSSLGE